MLLPFEFIKELPKINRVKSQRLSYIIIVKIQNHLIYLKKNRNSDTLF